MNKKKDFREDLQVDQFDRVSLPGVDRLDIIQDEMLGRLLKDGGGLFDTFTKICNKYTTIISLIQLYISRREPRINKNTGYLSCFC